MALWKAAVDVEMVQITDVSYGKMIMNNELEFRDVPMLMLADGTKMT